MSRYIDADALMANIPSEEMIAKLAVAHAPTIDAVSVVRCKKCKKKKEVPIAEYACFLWCNFHQHAVNEDDYCSYGEVSDEQ